LHIVCWLLVIGQGAKGKGQWAMGIKDARFLMRVLF